MPTAAPSQPRRKPSLDFSLTGLTFTSMMLFLGLAAVNSQANLLFGVFGLMIGVLLVAAMISRLVLKKLEVRRIIPEYAVVGQPVTLHYEFTNRKRYWPSLSVTVSELPAAEAFARQPQAYLLHVAPRTAAQVPTRLTPTRRGLHQLEKFQLSTSFPFGFIKRAVDRRREETILVYPAIGEVDQAFMRMCISSEQSGQRMKPRSGGSDEFYGIKEFRQGENPRWIYWRRSARTGTLVSRQMTHVAPPRVLILLDTFITELNMENSAAVERTIAMAASLISRAIDQGLAVGLHVWSGDWVTILPTRGKRHSHELLTLLARLPRNIGHDRRALLEHAHKLVEAGTTAVVMTPEETHQNLSEQSRGGWLTVSARSTQAQTWFTFSPEIDFAGCAPPEHDRHPERLHGQSERNAECPSQETFESAAR